MTTMNKQHKWITLADLITAEWNYKDGDEFMAARLEKAMRQDGQIVNLIVRDMGDGTWEVVNGNHRLQTMRRIGTERAMCFDLGQIDQERAEQIAFITNETEHAANEMDLATRLAELEKSMPDALLPFTDEQRQGMAALRGFSWEGYKPKPKPSKPGTPPPTSGLATDIILRIELTPERSAQVRKAEKILETKDDPTEFLSLLLTKAFSM